MRFTIDAPAKRSLSPTEKKVYNLLLGGNTPKEVAKITRLPYGTENTFCFDPTIPTIRNIITAIREKGWEIPEPNKNKEEIEMPKGTKISPEKAAKIKALRSEGKSFYQIEEITGVSRSAAQRICSKENEPVQAATCTDSGVDNIGNVSTPIINEKTEVVKSRTYSDLTISAVYDAITQKRCEIANLTREIDKRFAAIDKVKEMIGRLDNIRAYAEFELDTMLEDYAALCGEVAE